MRNGKIEEIGKEGASQPEAPFVHDDTLSHPVRNLVTGKLYDSTSAFKRSAKEAGCDIVGNDFRGRAPRRPKNEISEKVILDKIEKAESIASDPTKRRAHDNMNLERMERQAQSLGVNTQEYIRNIYGN